MEQFEEFERKKAYLKQYLTAIRREKRILEEIQRLRTDKMFPSIAIDYMLRGTSIKDLSDYMVLLEEEIEKLKKERLEKVKRYQDIQRKIKELHKEEEQEVLHLRYITGLTWEEAADEMGYTCRHIMRIHNAALSNLKLS